MKKLSVSVALVLFLFAVVPCAGAAEDTVKIGYLSLPMSLPTYVAQEKGYFTGNGVNVELIPFNSGTAIIDALVSGRIDVNGCSASTGHWLAAQNAPDRFKIFMMFGTFSADQDNTFVVVVKKDSPIQDLVGLKGKKVGTFPGGTSMALAKLCVRAKIDDAEVVFTEIPPPNMVPALAAGQIDAFFSPEPMGMMAVQKGLGRYLIKSPLTLLNIGNGVPGAAFSFNAKFLKEKPVLAQKVLAAIEKGVDDIRADDKAVRPYLVKYVRLPEPVAMGLPLDEWRKLSEFNKKAGQDYFDILYKEGIFKQKVDTTALYYE